MSTHDQYLFQSPFAINLQYGQAFVLTLNGGCAKASKNNDTPSENTSQVAKLDVWIIPLDYNSGARYPTVPVDLIANPSPDSSAKPKSQTLRLS